MVQECLAENSSKKLDIGMSFLRFKKSEDVPLKLISHLATHMTPEKWIEMFQMEYVR